MKFHDRTHAGFLLAEQLMNYKNGDGVVLAVPRGGIVVAYPIAHLLHLPLDLIFCKKIGHPSHPEFAIGAVSIDGSTIATEPYSDSHRDYIEQQATTWKESMIAKRSRLMGKEQPIMLKDKTVILVDDGIATGLTIEACLQCIYHQGPVKVILAVPVISRQAYYSLATKVDTLTSLLIPDHFNAVGEFYESFKQVGDDAVREILKDGRNIDESESTKFNLSSIRKPLPVE